MPKGLYRLQSFLSIQYVLGDLCKHLGMDSSTDHPDRYSNLFLKAYINRHVLSEYLHIYQCVYGMPYMEILYNSNITRSSYRVPTVREKSGKNEKISRSGKSPGILS